VLTHIANAADLVPGKHNHAAPPCCLMLLTRSKWWLLRNYSRLPGRGW
jgi:hypothetical protein